MGAMKSYSKCVVARPIKLMRLISTAMSLCFTLVCFYTIQRWTEKAPILQLINQNTIRDENSDEISSQGNHFGIQAESNATKLLSISSPLRNDLDRNRWIINQPSYNEVQPTVSQLLSLNKSMNFTSDDGVHENTQRKTVWLDEFTSDIPRDLLQLLQDILERDFEKYNNPFNKTLRKNSVERCKKGFFRLRGMTSCRKWLNCSEIKSLAEGVVIGAGYVKIVRASIWNGLDVAIASRQRKDPEYKKLIYGIQNMLLAQPSPYAVQVVGVCNHDINPIVVTENCEKRSLNSFHRSGFQSFTMLEKFKIAIQMVAIFDYLHRGMGLPRIHCDLIGVRQSFQQFVVSLDNRLFMSDLDDVSVVKRARNKTARCPVRNFQPGFLPPEGEITKKMQQLDTSFDVWKFPDLFANIMSMSKNTKLLLPAVEMDADYHLKRELEHIHNMCKNPDPTKRPSSKKVLVEYLKLYQMLLRKQT